MAIRHGAVIVFKKGVTKEEAARVLEKLRDVLDFPATTYKYEPTGKSGQVRNAWFGKGVRQVRQVEVPFETSHAIHEFEDEHGKPVFYIP